MTIPTAIAWGPADLAELPNGKTVWRMPFELLPGGTMLNAQCTLHGLVSVPVTVDDNPRNAEPRYQIDPGSLLEVYAINFSTPEELQPHWEEIVNQFRQHVSPENSQTA